MQYGWYDNIVILGDFNSDLSIANNNTLIETMMMFNLVNIISKTTRITDHSNTLLDPIIISDTINYIYSDNHQKLAIMMPLGVLRVLLVHLSGSSGYMKSINKYLSKN